MYILVIKQLVIMLVIVFSGFLITKIFHFGKIEQQFVSKTLLYFINPCLIVSHFNIDFNPELLKNFGIVIILSIIIHFVMIIVALIFARSKNETDKSLDCIDRVASVFTNCAFIGIPLISGVIGNEGVFYLLGFIVTFNIFLWTFGYMMMAGKIKIKKLFINPNIIAVFVGLILFRLPIHLPEIISKPVSLIGGMNTSMAMILLGMLFANFKKTEGVSYTVRVIKLCLIRHVIIAIVVFAVVFASFKLFPQVRDMRMICYVVYIAALCPVGMSVSSFSVIFNKDESYAALLCLVTSGLSVITLPLSVALAEMVF